MWRIELGDDMRQSNDRRLLLRAALAASMSAGGLHAAQAREDRDDDGFRIGGKPGRGWRLLGEARANRSVDRDEVRVRAGRAHTAIRLRVFDAPVEFLNIRIAFANGGSREVEVRQFVERGGATRLIDLPGERRVIERVVFWYKTPLGARERARVQVWGRG